MNETFNDNRTATGTREWSEYSFNIGLGCSNNCLYCYARQNALRYKKINSPDEWQNEIVSEKAISRAQGHNKNCSDDVYFDPTKSNNITNAYLKAKQARFEHGECG
jgi:DNA repair photolyase